MDEEVAHKLQDAERDGILMLIAHLRDLVPETSGAFKQLDSLHKMICDGAHKRYVESAILEEAE